MKKLGAILSFLFAFYSYGLHSEKFEKVPESAAGAPSEDQLTQLLIKKISEDVSKSGIRDAHPKDHGCVDEVKVKVLPNLGSLQVGAFAEAGHEYSAILRSSHGSSDPEASDNDKGPHGFALKILLDKVKDKKLREEVTKLPGEEYFLEEDLYKSLDIITINGIHEFMVATVADYPEFFAAVGGLGKIKKALKNGTPLNPEEFGRGKTLVEELKAKIEAGTFTPQVMGEFVPKFLNIQYWHLPQLGETDPAQKARPVEAGLMQAVGQLSMSEVFDPKVTYQSWVPSLLGKDQAVKYQFRSVPCQEGSLETGKVGEDLLKELALESNPNRLRETLKARLNKAPVCYELAVHVLEAGSEALVENASAPWPGKDKADAYKAVALVTIPQKASGMELMDDKKCEMLSMNPGHSPLDHKPIGGIQRSREKIYAAIETLRNKTQGNPVINP